MARYVKVYPTSDDIGKTPIVVEDMEGINGVGIEFQSKAIFNQVNVKDYGAVGDGITDDTDAIKNAISTITDGNGGSIYFPEGTYLITDSLIISQPYVELSGSKGTFLKFNPSTEKILFHLTGLTDYYGTLGSAHVYIHDFILTSSNAVKKTAIKIEDGHFINIERVYTHHADWTSSTNDCVGIHFCGREFNNVKDVFIVCEYPIIIDYNTQFYGHTGLSSIISCDLYHFENIALLSEKSNGQSSGTYNITVMNNASIYNLTIDHYWGGYGKGFFYLNNDGSTGSNNKVLVFKNGRHEQGDGDANSWMFYIKDSSKPIYNLNIENAWAAGGTVGIQGFNIANVRGLNIKNFMSNQDDAAEYTFMVDDVVGTFENVIGAASALHDFGSAEVTNLQFEHDTANYLYYWIKTSLSETNPSPVWNNISSLLNGWTLGETTSYFKDSSNIVHLKGALTGGTVNARIFTLPEGYRPTAGKQYAVSGLDGSSNHVAPVVISILTNGDTYIYAPSGTAKIYLDGITFRVD